MNFTNWAEKLEETIEILEKDREEMAMAIVSDILALLKRRIINERVDANGQPFGQYSEAVVPFWYYSDKESLGNAPQRADEMKERVGYWASYQDWREQNNLLGENINFSFTGEMWKSVIPVVVSKRGEGITIGIIASNENSAAKLNYQMHAYPNLLDLSPAEEKLLNTLNQERLNKAFQKTGL